MGNYLIIFKFCGPEDLKEYFHTYDWAHIEKESHLDMQHALELFWNYVFPITEIGLLRNHKDWFKIINVLNDENEITKFFEKWALEHPPRLI